MITNHVDKKEQTNDYEDHSSRINFGRTFFFSAMRPNLLPFISFWDENFTHGFHNFFKTCNSNSPLTNTHSQL